MQKFTFLRQISRRIVLKKLPLKYATVAQETEIARKLSLFTC